MEQTIVFEPSAGMLIAQIVGAALYSLIGALIVMLAARFVMGEAPTYGNAYGATFLAAVATALVGFAMSFLMIRPLTQLITFVVGFVIQTVIYFKVLHYPDGREISLGQALVISIVQFVVVVLLALTVGVALFALLAAGGMAGA